MSSDTAADAGLGTQLVLPPPPLMAEDAVIQALRDNRPFVIGLTGPFGSGCSTAAHLLTHEHDGFEPYVTCTLSVLLREFVQDDDAPSRHRLQDLGNAMRDREGTHALAVRALGQVFRDHPTASKIALDGIRNLGEVRWLREHLGDRFALFAVTVSSAKVRFERRRDVAQPWTEFYELDQRDQGESVSYGQQVGRCVDLADVSLPNDGSVEKWAIDKTLGEKVRSYALLFEGRAERWASEEELMMNAAYAASHGSKCLKRQVGAVIARGTELLAHGYNENPDRLKPCIDEFETCFRDIVRSDRFSQLAIEGAKCPHCGEVIPKELEPPWECVCGRSLDVAFFPDRAMKWCTALHAEERAIINAAGRDLTGCTLYSTTFPCMLCAEKIIHAGIDCVVYVDAYPDALSGVLLHKAGVRLERFEGVRSRNFERYFAQVRPRMEQQGIDRLKYATRLP